MKKYIGVLSVMTILSGCGTGMDFWNSKDPNPLATSGRRAPALNNGIGGMPTPPNPMMGQMGMNAPQADPYGMPPAIDDASMPPYPGAQGSIPMPPPPPEFNSPSPMGYATQAMPEGRRAPKFNQSQFAQAPAPYVSQQPIPQPAPYEPVAVAPAPIAAAPVAQVVPAPYQVTTITPEYRDTGVATLPPPPPPPTQSELAAQTSANALQPLGGKSVSEVEANMGVDPAPTKIIVPVKSPDAPLVSTDYRDLKPISASSPAAMEESHPNKVVVNIKPSGNKYDDSGYPVLANIPPAPPAPAPLQQDSRVTELKQDYSNSVSQAPTNGQVRITSNGFNAADIPPPPPPLPYEAAPAPQAPAKITVPVTVKSAPPMKLEASVEAPKYVEPPVPAYNTAPAPSAQFSTQPKNELVPQGPTVVIRSKNSGKSSTTSSAKPFHTSTADEMQPMPVASAPVQVLPAQTVPVNEVAMQPVTAQPYSQPPMQYQPASAPVVTVTASGATSEYPVASTNVDDLHPIAAASGTGHSYKPLLAQSRYSAMRAQARNSTRY